MIDSLYQLLEKIGYTHPIHPSLTHIPMGLIIGVFLFALISLIFRRTILPSLAYRRIIILALIFAFPTALFGYTDWQHFYEGEWLLAIKIKLVLTGLLFVLLFIAVLFGRKSEVETKGGLTIYTLCFLTVIVLGYFGGQLVFENEGRPLTVPVRFLAGEKLYAANCNECHPGGSGILNAPQLSDYNTFLAFIRNPKGPGGSQIGMPPFPPEKLSDMQGKKLYRYIFRVLQKPEKK